MPIQPVEKTISDYCAAYRRANGREVEITYCRGWYRVDRSREGKRESDILKMTDTLNARPPHQP